MINLKFIRKNEVKIFLTFFIIYYFFIHLVGWNEESRLALIRAIVEDKSVEIDNYANITGDRSFYNEHYYSDKAPGSSFLATPIYYIWKLIYDFFLKHLVSDSNYVNYIVERINYAIIYIPINLDFFTSISVILITTLSSLFGAISVVLVYKILDFLKTSEKEKLLLVFTFGLATLIFPYSLVFFGNIIATMLGFLSFYLIFTRRKIQSYYLLSGLLIGFSVVIEYTMIIMMFFYFFISFFYNREYLKWFLFGSLVGITPLLIYNLVIFKNPLNLSIRYIDKLVWPHQQIVEKTRIFGLVNVTLVLPKETTKSNFSLFLFMFIRAVFVLTFILFLPYRGLFFYYPILLFSLIGIYYMSKRYKFEAITIFFLLSSFILFNSIYFYWWGGSSFGPRYLLPIIPFLIIPLNFVMEKIKKNKILLSLFILLLLISFFHNIIGLEELEGPTLVYSFQTKTYKVSKIVLNPLYNHYLPLFLKNGPRSRVLEYLIISKTPDIRDFKPIPVKEIMLFTTSFGFLVLKIPFLIIPILLFIVSLIWKKELSDIFIFKRFSLYLILLFLSILLFVSRLESKNIFYASDWYPIGTNETIRFMEKDATIYIFSPEDIDAFLNISVSSYLNRTAEIHFNNKSTGFYKLAHSIFIPVKLKHGKNIVKIHSVEGCDRPFKTDINSSDVRCLSIGVEDINTIKKDKFSEILKNQTIYYGSNWYKIEKTKNETFRFMSQDGIIFLPYHPEKVKLNISIDTYKKSRILDLYLNDELVDSYLINSFFTNVLTPEIKLNKDINVLRFYSRENCDIPAKVENSNDKRCLSFAIKNITKLTVEDILKENRTLIFGKNWYSPEENLTHAYDNATIYYLSPTNKSVKFNISLSSYYKSRNIQLYVNNNLIETYRIEPHTTTILTPEIKIRKGENVIRFHLIENCDIPLEVEGINDTRCLSFGMENISTVSIDELLKKGVKILHGSNWYPVECHKNKCLRWFSQDATIYLLSEGEQLLKLSLYATSYKEPRTLEISLNGENIRSYAIPNISMNILTPLIRLRKGENVIRFFSREGCDVPYEIGDSGDKRCLSFAISDFKKLTISELFEKGLDIHFDKGFYSEERVAERSFRWMTKEGKITLLIEDPEIYRLTFDSWSLYKNRTLEVYLDNKLLYKPIILKEEKTISLPLIFLSRGEHSLKFSTKDCVYPHNDVRCLSIAISNFKKLKAGSPLSELSEELDKNWYDLEKDDKGRNFRWISQNATIQIFNPNKEQQEMNISFTFWNYYKPRTMIISLNEEVIDWIKVSKELSISKIINLKPGLNVVKFTSKEGCDVPARIEKTNDIRCLSFAIADLSLK